MNANSVRRPSDTRASNFIGAGKETHEYAVTDDPRTRATHPTLPGVGHNGEGHLDNAPFSRHWLIAYPSESGIYSQCVPRRSSSGGSPNHEHDTGGEQYGC